MSSPPLRPLFTSPSEAPTDRFVCCWCEHDRASELAVAESADGVRFGMCRSCLDERLRTLDSTRTGLRLAR